MYWAFCYPFMIKQLKHLIFILLIFGFTTTGYSGNELLPLASIPLFSEVFRKGTSNRTDSSLYVYGPLNLELGKLWATFLCIVNPREFHSTQLPIIIKIQTWLYKALQLDKVRQAFSPKLSTYYTSYSSLYLA